MPRRGPYSQAVRLGDLAKYRGQGGLDPRTGAPAGATFELQARQAFENLRAILEDAGSSLDRMVKTTCFLAAPEAFDELNALYAEFFPTAPPVRSAPVVRLPRGLLFSIEAIAAAARRRTAPNKRMPPTRADVQAARTRLRLIVAAGTLAALLAAPAPLQAQRPTTLAGRSTVYAPQRRGRDEPAARLRGRARGPASRRQRHRRRGHRGRGAERDRAAYDRHRRRHVRASSGSPRSRSSSR